MQKNNKEEEFPLLPNKKENVFSSTYHTLFLKDIAPNAIPKVGDEEYYRIVEPYTLYTLYLGSFAEKDRGLHELFNTLRQCSYNDFLDIRISSYGGSIDEGKQLHNIIKECFFTRTRTILDPVGYSMGALAFCMGNERLIYESSTIMFHDYSHMVGGKGGEIEAQVVHQSQSLRDFLYSVVVPHGFISEEEFDDMIKGVDFWMDAVEMCSRGIATHIVINGYKVPADRYLKYVDETIEYKEMITGIAEEKPKKVNRKRVVKKKKVSKKKEPDTKS